MLLIDGPYACTSKSTAFSMNLQDARVRKVDAKGSKFNTAEHQYNLTVNFASPAIDRCDNIGQPGSHQKEPPTTASPAHSNDTLSDRSLPRTYSSDSSTSSDRGAKPWAPTSPPTSPPSSFLDTSAQLMERPGDTYMRLLLSWGYGKPLWVPEPNDNRPKAYHKHGVHIGDVGFVNDDGVWDCLFNIRYPADHEINGNRVPEGFQPVDVHPDDIYRLAVFHGAGTEICSSSLTKYHMDRRGKVIPDP